MTTMPTIHPETAEAIKSAVRLGLESLRAEPPQRLGDWARDHLKLAGESSLHGLGTNAFERTYGLSELDLLAMVVERLGAKCR